MLKYISGGKAAASGWVALSSGAGDFGAPRRNAGRRWFHRGPEVDALSARSGGRYAVETVDSHGLHHLVPVTLGAFDDADGEVQVTGELQAGEQIVVPNV